jgi:hypothetical protein
MEPAYTCVICGGTLLSTWPDADAPMEWWLPLGVLDAIVAHDPGAIVDFLARLDVPGAGMPGRLPLS